MHLTLPDLTGVLMAAIIYFAYRVGRWAERNKWDEHYDK